MPRLTQDLVDSARKATDQRIAELEAQLATAEARAYEACAEALWPANKPAPEGLNSNYEHAKAFRARAIQPPSEARDV